AVVVIVMALGSVAPAGHDNGRVSIAAVQGGGPRGIRAQNSDMNAVFLRHVRATANVPPGTQVILWPEDVVDVDELAGPPEQQTLSNLAKAHQATLIAGVVEDVGCCHFRNAAVAWGPGGRQIDRYDKVHRVPFGEYFPGRSLISHFASIPDRDAIAG